MTIENVGAVAECEIYEIGTYDYIANVSKRVFETRGGIVVQMRDEPVESHHDSSLLDGLVGQLFDHRVNLAC